MLHETAVAACRPPELDACLPRVKGRACVKVVPTSCHFSIRRQATPPPQTSQSKTLVLTQQPTSVSRASPIRSNIGPRQSILYATPRSMTASQGHATMAANACDHLGRLPAELFCMVVEDPRLSKRDLSALAATCRKIYTLTNPSLYQKHLKEESGQASK